MSLSAASKSSVALASLAAFTIFSAPLVWALFKIRKRITAPLVLWAALDNVPLYSSIPKFKSFIFTTILGFVNPYSRSIPLTIKTLSEGRCDAEMVDRNSIRNPFASIHACALTLLAETVGGLAVFTTLDKKKKDRAIVTRIDTAYFKKSRGCIVATCTFQKPTKPGKYSLVPCDVEMRDKATGDLTAKATIYWEIDVKE